MITQKTIQEVMNTAKVEDVVGDFVNLRRRGVNLIGNCPFHDEKTPSFTVSPSKNIYKCFGCGKAGDPVRFIMDHEHISFPESIRFLAQKYRIEVEETEQTAQEIENKHIIDSYYIVNQFAKDYYTDVLFNRAEGKNIGLSYFKERGFREATIKKFQLGYATDDRDEFTKKAIDKKFNIEHLRTLGLTTKSDVDFFRARVMFTIHNISGKVVAFAGRTLSSDKKQPKYINSPESDIYNKRAVLYGLYFAKEAIRKQDECILVEGYTDVISLHQGGIENVVASSGTSLTKEQIRLVKRYTPNIKIIYDGDQAGIKAALRGLDLVLESDLNVKLVLLPDGHDPDSFLASQGSDAFNQYLKDREEDFILFKTRVLLDETANDPIRKTIVIRDIVTSIAKIPDAIKRNLYIRRCADMLDMSESLLIEEVGKVIKSDIRTKKEDTNKSNNDHPVVNEDEWLKPKPSLSEDEPVLTRNDAWQEKAICEILVNYGDREYDQTSRLTVAQFILENTKDFFEYMDIPLYKKILEKVSEHIASHSPPNHSWYVSHDDEEIRTFAVNALSTPYVYASWEKKEMFLQTQKMPDENYVRDATNAVQRFQLRKSNHLIKGLETYLREASPEVVETEDYAINFKVYQALLVQRNSLAEKLGTVTF
jgi:DNA primase